jgi:PAS domain S-box-containing protein
VTSWNIGGQRIKGYLPEEIMGRHFSTFYTETDRANGKPARALRIAEETGRYEEEGWRVRKDGTFFWASVVIDPIREDGELVGFAKITRDITERREAQLNLERMQQQLAQSQKLDALGQLTGGVAHDFNNLLMIISGSLHTLRKGVDDDDTRLQRALSAIEAATRRGAALTSQLLTFARRQNLNPLAVDVTERINAVRDVLSTGVGGTVKLQFDIGRSVWPVMVDVAELETALVNLVINARDAMTGGVITISARNDTLRDEVNAGEYVAIAVEDTGAGIAPDILSKIFDPFFTTKPIGKGTGLGLSQVHGFAHQAGGTVKVASELGKGTRITILLPRKEAAPAAEDVNAAETGGSGIVLLVEDNPEVASVSTNLLEQLGYTVRRVANAEAALREIELDGIDLVFSDIVMPGKMDGLSLARHLKAVRPGLPILLTSGYSDAALNVRGDFPILRKPYEIHELSQAIAKLPR